MIVLGVVVSAAPWFLTGELMVDVPTGDYSSGVTEGTARAAF